MRADLLRPDVLLFPSALRCCWDVVCSRCLQAVLGVLLLCCRRLHWSVYMLIQPSYFSLSYLFFCFVAASRKVEAAGSDFLRHPPHVLSGRHHGAVPHRPVAPGLARTLPLLYERQSHTGTVLWIHLFGKVVKKLFFKLDICQKARSKKIKSHSCCFVFTRSASFVFVLFLYLILVWQANFFFHAVLILRVLVSLKLKIRNPKENESKLQKTKKICTHQKLCPTTSLSCICMHRR